MIYPKLKKHLRHLERIADRAPSFDGMMNEVDLFKYRTKDTIEYLNLHLFPYDLPADPLGIKKAFCEEIEFRIISIARYSLQYANDVEYIYMIPKNWCNSEALYLSVLLHETTHATGHIKRVNRNTIYSSYGPDIQQEECVAQLSAYVLLEYLGLSDELVSDMTGKYLKRYNFLNLNKEILCQHVDAATKYILDKLK